MWSSWLSRPGVGAGLALVALATGACQHGSGAQRIVGPDGSHMSHVHCGGDQAACFRIAGELCPSGYDLQPVLRGDDGNFLVRCRAAALAVAPACPTTTPVTMTRTPTLPSSRTEAVSSASQTWPPSNEPWPAAYPWPPPETTAGVRPAPAPLPSQEIDLGY